MSDPIIDDADSDLPHAERWAAGGVPGSFANLLHDEIVRLRSERTCATCIHWDPPDLAAQWHDWDKVPEQDMTRWSVCELIGMPDYGEVCTTTAFTQDGSDYKATLHARSDFGCTLHEAKP